MSSLEAIRRDIQRAEEMSLQYSLDELENSVQGMLKRDCIEYYNYYKRNLRDFRRLIREQENEDEINFYLQELNNEVKKFYENNCDQFDIVRGRGEIVREHKRYSHSTKRKT